LRRRHPILAAPGGPGGFFFAGKGGGRRFPQLLSRGREGKPNQAEGGEKKKRKGGGGKGSPLFPLHKKNKGGKFEPLFLSTFLKKIRWKRERKRNKSFEGGKRRGEGGNLFFLKFFPRSRLGKGGVRGRRRCPRVKVSSQRRKRGKFFPLTSNSCGKGNLSRVNVETGGREGKGKPLSVFSFPGTKKD